MTQNQSEIVYDRVMSFLPVTASFTFLRFHNHMSLEIRGEPPVFFTTYFTTLTGAPPHRSRCSDFSGSMQGH